MQTDEDSANWNSDALCKFLKERTESRLLGYQSNLDDIQEHFNIEATVLAGGYGYRQILELVQNGADAILEARLADSANGPDRIDVELGDGFLCVANTGAPLSENGLRSLLSSHFSPKRGDEIGRFGLGFKSLLRLQGKIEIFSKATGGIFFDPKRCRDTIKRHLALGAEVSVPSLRIAWPLAETQDLNQPDLMQFKWAETVVKAWVENKLFVEELRKEIDSFPAEFLLFIKTPVTINLNNGLGSTRSISVNTTAGHIKELSNGEVTLSWYLAESTIKVDDEAVHEDATHIHSRDSIPLIWATSLSSGYEVSGRFWAFFPTQTESYLPGILNAPWKLNTDRNALIPGLWNSFLMQKAADLVANTIPGLSLSEDPGRVLDAFPRVMDSNDAIASPLINNLWVKLAATCVIPDGNAELKRAESLFRPPADDMCVVAQWEKTAEQSARAKIVHSSCFSKRHRSSRLDAFNKRLIKADAEAAPNLRRMDLASWLELVKSDDPQICREVLHLARNYSNICPAQEWSNVRRGLAIIPVVGGGLVHPGEAVLADDDISVPGRKVVVRWASENAEIRLILEDTMGVKSLEDSEWITILAEAFDENQSASSEEDWARRWKVLRSAPETAQNAFLLNHRSKVRVRRRDGRWVIAQIALLPGGLVQEGDTANQKHLVDSVFHGEDDSLLKSLGLRDVPQGTYESIEVTAETPNRPLYLWLEYCRDEFYSFPDARHQSARKRLLNIRQKIHMPYAAHFLIFLDGEPLVAITSQLIQNFGTFPDKISFGHSALQNYQRIQVPHPLSWLIITHGAMAIGKQVVRLKAVRSRSNYPGLRQYWDSNDLQAVNKCLPVKNPSFEPNQHDLKALWCALISEKVNPQSLMDDSLEELWSWAAKDGVVPQSLPSVYGDVAIKDVFVTTSADLAASMRSNTSLIVKLFPETLELWLNEGARNLEVQPFWDQEGDPTDLLTVIPEIKDVLKDGIKSKCRAVVNLTVSAAGISKPVPCIFWNEELLLDYSQLNDLPKSEQLHVLLNSLSSSGLLKLSYSEAIERIANCEVERLRNDVLQEVDLPEKLLRAVGSDKILTVFGEMGNAQWLRDRTGVELSRLAIAQFGPSTLMVIKDALQENGLRPPKKWGGTNAIKFVASIGFPTEFAFSRTAQRLPEENISGPFPLPDLHDFQETVFEGIKALLDSRETKRRAVVSLPTGGGKTRVTVEAAVRLVLNRDSGPRTVLWVAQSDELCEQAVQAFRQVWSNKGLVRRNLRIVRFWASHPNPQAPTEGDPVVVVASIQTLNSRISIRSAGLAWLQRPGLLVIDECHHAIAPSYTGLLGWLSYSREQVELGEEAEPPILGLSATPFRMDDDETRRLADRFCNRWFPNNQAELYDRLIKEKILSKVDHEGLVSSVDISQNLMREIDQADSVEGFDRIQLLDRINEELSKSENRNLLLIERLKDIFNENPERSVLVFANSVQHANELSARLNLEGITSAAISSETDRSSRRWFIDRFQQGKVRVLCNHSVLTTGFDAPKTDTILISRQVFSPVRYMQMVGRGLRGPRNGGTEFCKIISVIDNLGRFNERHPYHYCSKFFDTKS